GISTVFMAQMNGGFNTTAAKSIEDPMTTVTNKPFTKTQQVHMCGNSVSPPPMAALARANDPWRAVEQQAAAA
ncbi:hypothetical protein, partial [Pseudomonas sp. NPDC087614]|uniref:hypothetical protein n=1 Tax=Pseudomonas sp. NPDC087614 TaxID=3364442 RepID=UPI0037FE8AA4